MSNVTLSACLVFSPLLFPAHHRITVHCSLFVCLKEKVTLDSCDNGASDQIRFVTDQTRSLSPPFFFSLLLLSGEGEEDNLCFRCLQWCLGVYSFLTTLTLVDVEKQKCLEEAGKPFSGRKKKKKESKEKRGRDEVRSVRA